MTETTIPLTLNGNSLSYVFPNVANQPTGPLPLGKSVEGTGVQLPFIDGGPDSRIQSACYAAGRLYVTLPTQVFDSLGNSAVGGIFAILSPTFRGNVLGGSVVKQGYLSVAGNHLLRPSVSVDANGRGAIAFTLVGPSYFATAAYQTFNTTFPNIGTIDPTPPSAIVIAGAGALAE